VVFRDLVFNAEVIEQRLGTGMVSHHKEQASVNGAQEKPRQTLRRCRLHFRPTPGAKSRRLFQQPRNLSTVTSSSVLQQLGKTVKTDRGCSASYLLECRWLGRTTWAPVKCLRVEADPVAQAAMRWSYRLCQSLERGSLHIAGICGSVGRGCGSDNDYGCHWDCIHFVPGGGTSGAAHR
jgi:hypothetical protein